MKATRLFAVMAVLAMVFAGIAVIAEQNDAANEPAVICFAEGKDSSSKYNEMMVFGYADNSIIINTTYMDLGKAMEFKVTITNASDATKTTTVGPLSAQNGKIVIDAGATLFASNATLTVALYDYASSAQALSTASLVVPTDKTTAISFDLYTNHLANFKDANNFDKAHTNASGETVATKAVAPITVSSTTVVAGGEIKRNVAIQLDQDTNAAFKDTNKVFVLKGWSIGNAETSDIDFYPGNYTIEEIIMTLADKHMNDTKTETKPQYAPIPAATTAAAANLGVDQVANKLILNAIYEKNTYSLLLAYGLDANGVPEAGYGINDIAFPKADSTADPAVISTIKASVTSKVDADSFGTIKIQQLVPGQYTYGFTVYKANGTTATGEKKYTEDTTGTNYKIKMVTNGVFKIYGVKSDLVITIKPKATTSPTAFDKTGYAFQIDAITNESNHGKVKLSLDLYDYTPMIGTNKQDKITIAGTYYKDLKDGVRAYGNLANCGQVAAGENVNLYIDNSEDATNTKIVSGEIASTLIAPEAGLEGNSVYDLVWNDKSTTDPAIGIYAAQGVWDQYSEDTTSATATQVYTPWSLFTA